MKRSLKFVMPLMIILSAYFCSIVYAQDVIKATPIVRDSNASSYDFSTGTVVKVVNQNDFIRVLVRADDDEIKAYKVLPTTYVTDGYNVLYMPREGETITIICNKKDKFSSDTPQQRDASFILAGHHSYEIMIETFDDEFLTQDKKNRLSISNSAEVVDYLMNSVDKQSLANKQALVFYSSISKDTPGTIFARRVIVLNTEPLTYGVNKTITNYFDSLEGVIDIDDTKYIKLFDIASFFGYVVSWNQEDQAVTVARQGIAYKFNIDSKNLTYNNSNTMLAKEPVLHEGSTYISYDFALRLAYDRYQK